MGVYIKGMEMPKNCEECAIKSWDTEDYVCPFSGVSTLCISRQADCPLVPVPPHGDLIDKKTVSENLASVLNKKNPPFSYPDWNDAIIAMLTAPTIIPEEPGEEKT